MFRLTLLLFISIPPEQFPEWLPIKLASINTTFAEDIRIIPAPAPAT